MSSFTQFHRSSLLKRAALTAMATQLTGQEVLKMRKQFTASDTDGNGTVSREELFQAVKADPPRGVVDVHAWVDDIFDTVDSDGSGEISITEWRRAPFKAWSSCRTKALGLLSACSMS